MKLYRLLHLNKKNEWDEFWDQPVSMNWIVYALNEYNLGYGQVQIYDKNFTYKVDAIELMKQFKYEVREPHLYNSCTWRRVSRHATYTAKRYGEYRKDPVTSTGNRRWLKNCRSCKHRHNLLESARDPEFNRKGAFGPIFIGWWDGRDKKEEHCWKDKKIEHQWEKNISHKLNKKDNNLI